VAVRLALVVQPGDGLLADVATLGEADGALVDARLLRHRLGADLTSQPRSTGLDPRDLGGLRFDRGGARPEQVLAHVVGGPGRDQQVDAAVGGDRKATRPGDQDLAMRVLRPGGDVAGELRGPRPDQGEQRLAVRPGLDGRVAAHLVHLQVPEEDVAGRRLGVDQQAVGGESQHPHVGADLALAVEERRVTALAGCERLDVVGELSLQELRPLAAADHQAGAIGAVEEPRLLADGAVLRVDSEGVRWHRWIVGADAFPPRRNQGFGVV